MNFDVTFFFTKLVNVNNADAIHYTVKEKRKEKNKKTKNFVSIFCEQEMRAV